MKKTTSQDGVIALSTVLLVFTVCGLISSAVKTGQAMYNAGQIQKLAQEIKKDALYLRNRHKDNPTIVAQADAWERMADLLIKHENKAFGKTALDELTATGINLVPGVLPFAKGTRELIELGKDVYDVQKGLREAYGEAREPSKEMVEFFKVISKGKISADALRIAMMKTQAQALNREVVKLKADLQAQKEWNDKQREYLDHYERLFIENSLKSAQEQLEKDGKLSAYYKDLFSGERFKNDLANYPQITESLNKIDEWETVTEEEMNMADQVAIETIKEDEVIQQALAEAVVEDTGDWREETLKMMAKVMEASVMPHLSEEIKQEYESRLKECEALKNKAQEKKEYGDKKQKEDASCSEKCGPTMINGSINSAALECIRKCAENMDITAGLDSITAEWDYEECVDEARQWLFSH